MSRKTIDQRAMPTEPTRTVRVDDRGVAVLEDGHLIDDPEGRLVTREEAWGEVLLYDRLVHKILNRFVVRTIGAGGGHQFYGYDRYRLAEELLSAAQEAMLKAVERFNPNGGANFMTYAYQAVLNNLQQHLQLFIAHAGIRTDSLEALLDPEDGENFDEPGEDELGYDEVDMSASSEAIMAFLEEGLGLLTEKERAMLVLSAEGLTTSAIAGRLGIARQTAYNRLAVARHKMKRFLIADARIEGLV